jgi:hypothetical protein
MDNTLDGTRCGAPALTPKVAGQAATQRACSGKDLLLERRGRGTARSTNRTVLGGSPSWTGRRGRSGPRPAHRSWSLGVVDGASDRASALVTLSKEWPFGRPMPLSRLRLDPAGHCGRSDGGRRAGPRRVGELSSGGSPREPRSGRSGPLMRVVERSEWGADSGSARLRTGRSGSSRSL